MCTVIHTVAPKTVPVFASFEFSMIFKYYKYIYIETNSMYLGRLNCFLLCQVKKNLNFIRYLNLYLICDNMCIGTVLRGIIDFYKISDYISTTWVIILNF